jgi:hypothetical protein
MSNQEQQQEQQTDIKQKNMIGYVHYGENDDLTKLFDVFNEFRKNCGLKYSHQGKLGQVFFSISSEHLDAFSKVRPFKISRYQTRSEYKCDKEISDKLMGQRDSFVRMVWDENTCVLTFLSRTPARVHGNLIRRIFTDSGVEFQKDNYNVLRNFLNSVGRNGEAQDNDNDNDDEEVNKQETNTKTPSHFLNKTRESTPEGFQRVESKKGGKYKDTNRTTNFAQSTKTYSKVLKEFDADTNTTNAPTNTPTDTDTNANTNTNTRPMIRGAKKSGPPRTPKTNA